MQARTVCVVLCSAFTTGVGMERFSICQRHFHSFCSPSAVFFICCTVCYYLLGPLIAHHPLPVNIPIFSSHSLRPSFAAWFGDHRYHRLSIHKHSLTRASSASSQIPAPRLIGSAGRRPSEAVVVICPPPSMDNTILDLLHWHMDHHYKMGFTG